jgi:fructose-1,6-bisphosphatase/inositol monophosphatase family enzyme
VRRLLTPSAQVAESAEPALAAAPAPSTPSAFADELRFALNLADQAGALLLDRYERVERVDYKSARDVVTEVDHLSEELVIAAIRDVYPDDAILAEESGEHHAVRGESPTVSVGRTWVVDPLDGTVNYANGIPFFCVSIGLVIDGRPTVGVVHDPTRGETFATTSDGPTTIEGARWDGSRQVVASDKEKLSDFVISLALSGRAVAGRLRAVRKAIRIPRTMGSAALALAYVGNGRFDAFVQEGGLSAWDVAAAGLIAERGGATVTDMSGGPWFDLGRSPQSVGILAAPRAHHQALLALVARAPAR